jgi:tungstate transport system ATP-binding protein
MRSRASGLDLPIRFDKVSIADRDVTILDDISVEIEAGAPTVLIGPNGAGKTTFLRAAMGLIAPTRGRISWGGREKSPPSHRAFVFQKPAMLRRSAAGNLRYAMRIAGRRPGRDDRRIDELLGLVGLGDLGRRSARQLSGGEQKRLALARALAREPDLLLLDEPTASLDPAAAKAVEDVIGTISASGIKIVMSTHDLGEARRLAGEIVLLHRGRIVERGPAAEFLNAPKTREARTFIAGELLI